MQRFFVQFTMDLQQLSYEELNQYNANFGDLFESFESDLSFQFTNQSPPFIHIENPGIQMISNFRNEGRTKKSRFKRCTQDQEIMRQKTLYQIKMSLTQKQLLSKINIKQTHLTKWNTIQISLGSIKNADTEDVIIGRQEKLENSQGQLIFPNYIILRESERLISRIHCKIIYKDFFKEETSILPFYKKTLGEIKLPFNIIQRIQSFLEEPKDCYVQDIGSVFGTHIKISRNYSTIKKYQQYSIGSKTTIQILEIHNLGSEQKSRDQEFDKLISKLRNVKYNCSLQGLDLKLYQKTLQIDQSFDEILTNLKCYKIPFIVIKLEDLE